jgi:hypothetical protein
MTDKAISPLRRRMIEDMTIRKLAPKTQASYIRAVRDFSIFLGCPRTGRARRICGAITCIWLPAESRFPARTLS